MNLIASIIAVVCVANAGCTGVLDDPSRQNMIFDLPAPWAIELEAGTATIGADPGSPGSVPEAKISVYVRRMGTDADAKRLAARSLEESDGSVYLKPALSESTIAGRKVYLYEGVSYDGSHTLMFFEKDGRVVNIILYDQLATYRKDIETLVTTLRWERM
jgi:hypothetical protein